MTQTFASSVYGPVESWRLGWSLGVDLLLHQSTCTFNCIYCQLGDIQLKTDERKAYVSLDKLEADLLASDWQKADVVTFSGNGEPTLAANLSDAIALVKRLTAKPVMVLTNATLLHQSDVRDALKDADHVACKLDAASDLLLQRMNRPVAGVSHSSIVDGIMALRASFQGKLSLQCMFMPSNSEETAALAQLIAQIRPDEVQLNTPKRPYPLEWVVESRGNHGEPIVESRTLRVISPEEASHIEATLQAAIGDAVPILSIYRPTPA